MQCENCMKEKSQKFYDLDFHGRVIPGFDLQKAASEPPTPVKSVNISRKSSNASYDVQQSISAATTPIKEKPFPNDINFYDQASFQELYMLRINAVVVEHAS